MTEQNQSAPEAEQLQSPENQAPDIENKSPEEQSIHMKNVLLQAVHERYYALVEVINRLPLANNIKGHALMNLDQGLMWVAEGVKMIKFNFEKPSAEGEVAPEEKPSVPAEPTVEKEPDPAY